MTPWMIRLMVKTFWTTDHKEAQTGRSCWQWGSSDNNSKPLTLWFRDSTSQVWKEEKPKTKSMWEHYHVLTGAVTATLTHSHTQQTSEPVMYPGKPWRDLTQGVLPLQLTEDRCSYNCNGLSDPMAETLKSILKWLQKAASEQAWNMISTYHKNKTREKQELIGTHNVILHN